MSEYQVIARRYRPKRFADVLGQEAIVTTLRNMIRLKQTAHAYLFCGAKGTGKTTLARLFAKALNCHSVTAEGEACNACPSCREIASSHSMNIIEIDGASHRGIEDIRKINETVSYAPSVGRYKIYIIDEVHMLTKEAFNALLKTLEEPPPAVKFFFATTEVHKVLPTILSRCQRFNLNRIAPEAIALKLQKIAQEMQVQVEPEALQLIATLADGGLRDAESLFDQVLAFHGGVITPAIITAILGVVTREVYFQIDEAGSRGDLSVAFTLSEQLFMQGKDLLHFVDGLIAHLRNLIVVKVAGKDSPQVVASPEDRLRYEKSAALYHHHQLLDLLDELIEAQARIRFAPSLRVTIEALLLRVLRSHQRISLDVLVKKLAELESALANPPAKKQEPASPVLGRVNEDPTPRREEMGGRTARHDTLLQFSAVELQGTIERNRIQKG
jgi:DNA polymerase-3 subunit gamma/tau